VKTSYLHLSPGLLVAYPRGPKPHIPTWLIFLAGLLTGWLTHQLFIAL
jgi:hypothetical protein